MSCQACQLFEEIITDVYGNVLRPGDRAIDMGAHSGRHTIPMANAVSRRSEVLLFEAAAKMTGILRQKLIEAGAHEQMVIH